jgi:cell division protein FtsL
METLIHADIFFFITSVAVVLVTAILLLFFWHLYKLTRTLRNLAEQVEREAGEYIEASEDFRERMREHPVVNMFFGEKKHPRTKKRKLEE